MPRTPQRFPGVAREDDSIQFEDRGSDPVELGSVWRKGDELFARDDLGVFNLRQGGGGSDENVKVSANDTTAGKLNGKLVAGSGVTLTEENDGGNETLRIDATGGTSVLCHLIITTEGGIVYDNGGEPTLKAAA